VENPLKLQGEKYVIDFKDLEQKLKREIVKVVLFSEGLAQSLEGIGRRFLKRTGRANPLGSSIEDIINNRQGLEENFLEFFPQLQSQVSQHTPIFN